VEGAAFDDSPRKQILEAIQACLIIRDDFALVEI
jgi:hypothetical protein